MPHAFLGTLTRIGSFFTRHRVALYAAAPSLFVVLVGARVLADAPMIDANPETKAGGDYIAFYAAGLSALDGVWDDLYEADTQRSYQEPHLSPEEEGRRIVFPYPPFVAAAYAPLATMPFAESFQLHATAMAGLVFLALWLLQVPLSRLREWFVPAAVCLPLLMPLTSAVLGGQNTPVSFVALAGIGWALERRQPTVAGLFASILWFKPQYAILSLVGLAAAGHLTAAAVTVAMGAVIGLTTTAIAGPQWPVVYVQALRRFAEQDWTLDPAHSVAPHRMLRWVIDDPATGSAVGAVLSLLLGGTVLWRLRQHQSSSGIIAGITVLLLLATPRVGFYDAGIIFVPLMVLANHFRQAALLPILGITAVLTWSVMTSPPTPFPAMLCSLAVAAVWFAMPTQIDPD